ncbi:MAG: glutathione S-transferase family protein [Burkholderiales bacterium]
MKLYDMPLSGNCHKIRLFLSILNIPYEKIAVDFQDEAKKAAFSQINPRAQVPVLDDSGTVIWDSMAILVYLARQYGGETWLPSEAKPLANVMQWLALSENEILYGLARSRAIKLFKRPWDLAQCQEMGSLALHVVEERLSEHPWLANDRISIADIACYPYVALAPEGGLPLDDYPHIRQWCARIQALPGFAGMPGLPETVST